MAEGTNERGCWCGGKLGRRVHPEYRRCASCGTVCLDERPDESELRRLYALDDYWRKHQAEVNHPPIEQRAVNDFADRIPVWFERLRQLRPDCRSVLEIGCAHGGFLHYARSRGIADVVGIEVDEQTCAFARRRFGLPHVISGFFPDVALPIGRFDAVVGFDVLEHFSDPLRAMAAVRELLAPDGVFLFQTPWYRGEEASWIQFRSGEHIYIYDAPGVHRLMRRAGLEAMRVEQGLFPDDMFVSGRRGDSVRRVIQIRNDSIGDGVLASALWPHMRSAWPKARITVVCQKAAGALIEHCPHIDAVITCENTEVRESPEARASLAELLAREEADLCISSVYSRSEVTDFLAHATQARDRIALGGDLANISPAARARNDAGYTQLLESSGAWKSELARHRDLLRELGMEADGIRPEVWTSAEDAAEADAVLGACGFAPERTVALFAGAQFAVRRYEGFGRAIGAICGERGLSVVAVGAPDEAKINQRNLADLEVPSANLCGRTPLRVAAEIIRRCRLAVGTETGLAHIAAAVGTPNVILLGGGHFARFIPWSALTSVVCLPLECYGCYWHCRYARPHCVQDVPAEAIEVAAREALDERAIRPRVYVADRSFFPPSAGRPGWSWFHHLLPRREVDVLAVSRRVDGRVRVTPLLYPARHRALSGAGPTPAARRDAAYRCLLAPVAEVERVFAAVAAPLLAGGGVHSAPAALDEAVILDELLAGLGRGAGDVFSSHYRMLAPLYLGADEIKAMMQ